MAPRNLSRHYSPHQCVFLKTVPRFLLVGVKKAVSELGPGRRALVGASGQKGPLGKN